MPVPKRKRSRARRDSRFANKGMAVATITQCAQCSASIMPHQACKECGFYKGRKVLRTKTERLVVRNSVRKKRVESTRKKERLEAKAQRATQE